MIGSAGLVGVQLGNYEIQALLGAGGMASVYRGFDRNLRRPVAIKVLSESAAQPDFAQRFRQEARLLAGLRHPNIVQVYDFGEQDGLSYMVQELLPGPTLQQQLRDLAARCALPTREQVLSIVAQLAGALDAAHAAGIIHRDVKPANILIAGSGTGDWGLGGAASNLQSPAASSRVVLTDFGIAKNTLLPAQTRTGLVIGTPDYLSPEQARGLPLTPSSDIYSLGVVLYELLAGRLPFAGGTALGVAMSHIHDAPPPLLQFRRELPGAVEAVVQQALAKEPAARFRTAGALAQALERAWPAAGIAATPIATGIHEQPTSVWEGPAARSAPVVPSPRALPSPMPRESVARSGRKRSSGRLLGLLLAVLLLGAIALLGRVMWLGDQTATPEAPPPQGAPAPAQSGSAPQAQATSAPEPTAAPEPSAAPEPTVSPPTNAPEPTAAPATAAPAPPNGPLDQLRALLEAGKADGRAGRSGGAMLADLSKARQALDDGNKDRAADRLRDLQKRLVDGVKSKKVDADFAREALAGIDAIAKAYEMELPPIREKDN